MLYPGLVNTTIHVSSYFNSVPKGRVSQLRVVSLTSKTIELTWNDVICAERGGLLRNYDVFVKTNDVTIQILSSQTNEAYVTGLKPYSNYTVQVRYVNNIQNGPLSDELHVVTLQDGK